MSICLDWARSRGHPVNRAWSLRLSHQAKSVGRSDDDPVFRVLVLSQVALLSLLAVPLHTQPCSPNCDGTVMLNFTNCGGQLTPACMPGVGGGGCVPNYHTISIEADVNFNPDYCTVYQGATNLRCVDWMEPCKVWRTIEYGPRVSDRQCVPEMYGQACSTVNPGQCCYLILRIISETTVTSRRTEACVACSIEG